jgi:3'(2'), 5'-bisphosphate nucleotidase
MLFSQDIIDALKKLIFKVGQEISKIYYDNSFSVYLKEDSSPVTNADMLASEMIIASIRSITPDIPIISEEMPISINLKILEESKRYWLIDPIDGTKSFIKKNGDFTINIALIEEGRPVFGLIYHPIKHELFYTNHEGKTIKETASSKDVIQVNKDINLEHGLNLLLPNRSIGKIGDRFVKAFKVKSSSKVSSSYKFCLLAEGKFDIYGNFISIFLWDVAAGHAILNGAGGKIYHTSGEELIYVSGSLYNPHFIAISSYIPPEYIKSILHNIKSE